MHRKLPSPDSERLVIRQYASWGALIEFEYSGSAGLSEDVVTGVVAAALHKQGFTLRSRGKGQRGPDVEAFSTRENVIVEAKGEGNEPDKFYNLLMTALGQILLRMNDPKSRHVVALPWHRRYVELIRRVPQSVRQKLSLQFWLVAPVTVAQDPTGETDYHVGIFSWDAE